LAAAEPQGASGGGQACDGRYEACDSAAPQTRTGAQPAARLKVVVFFFMMFALHSA
jgi:hypothetical protein